MADPIDLAQAFTGLTFLPDRTPTTKAEQAAASFRELAAFRDGAIYAMHYAGSSEWERHCAGDELVFVVEGSTSLFLLGQDGVEHQHALGAGQMLVVPRSTWHRFETANAVKIITVTPQPTDHSVQHPSG